MSIFSDTSTLLGASDETRPSRHDRSGDQHPRVAALHRHHLRHLLCLHCERRREGADQVGLFIAQVVALVSIHIALAIWRGTQKADERDAVIEIRSFRNAYVVLTSSVSMVTIGYLLWGGIASEPEAVAAGVAPPSVALVGNAILLCFVLAEIAKSGTQLVLYRKGAL